MTLNIYTVLTTTPDDNVVGDSLSLPFDMRQKSRFKAVLESGTEVGIFLERGKILRDGESLQAENGLVIKLSAAKEHLSTVTSSDTLLLAKLCYHLGNRHIPLQITTQQIFYQKDSVLDDMVLILGGKVQHQFLPFEPEQGAYSDTHKHVHTPKLIS